MSLTWDGFPERLTWGLIIAACVIFIADYAGRHARAWLDERRKDDHD